MSALTDNHSRRRVIEAVWFKFQDIKWLPAALDGKMWDTHSLNSSAYFGNNKQGKRNPLCPIIVVNISKYKAKDRRIIVGPNTPVHPESDSE